MAEASLNTIGSDIVEQNLLQYISEAKMQPGDILPSENRLSELLQVGRPTVREGLSRLRAYGMVRGNRRGGNILCKSHIFASLNRLMHFHLMQDSVIQGLMAVRVMFELGSATYVFRNATNADFRELRRLAAAEGPVAECDIKFHRKLFSIGNNVLLEEDFDDLLNAVFNMEGYVFPETQTPPQEQVTHADLCEELEHGTEASYHAALRSHLHPYEFLFAPRGTTPRTGVE